MSDETPATELTAALAAMEAEIEAQYWRFSRSSSPRIKPPCCDLQVRRNELKDRINNLRNVT